MGSTTTPDIAEAYVDLLKNTLSRIVFDSYEHVTVDMGGLTPMLDHHGLKLIRPLPAGDERRYIGRCWPADAETMIGIPRLENVQHCVETVLADGVPGDLIETGVWRGGACIFMRGILKAHGDTTRTVWVADSFQGLPKPNPELYPADAGDTHHEGSDSLGVSREQVAANFERYGLLDDQVQFLEGWFKDTLPTAPIESVAVMRLDGDMYESTMDALTALYDKLSPGGFCIIDDYGAVPGCKLAVDDFRRDRGITEELVEVDWTGMYWRKAG